MTTQDSAQLTADSIEVEPEAGAPVAAPEPPAPARIAWAPTAKVNLLPIEIIESRRFRRTQVVLGGLVVVVVLAIAGATVWAQTEVTAADKDLVVAQATVTTLQQEQAKFSAVPRVVSMLEAAQNARMLALGNEVLMHTYLNELDGARPAGIDLTGLTLGLQPALTADPLAPTGIGTITVTGTAVRYDQVSAWMDALDKVNGTAATSLTNATRNDTGLTFSSSSVITADALSGRYQKKAG